MPQTDDPISKAVTQVFIPYDPDSQILSIVGFQVAINNGNNVCILNRVDLLVLQVSRVVLARGQQGVAF